LDNKQKATKATKETKETKATKATKETKATKATPVKSGTNDIPVVKKTITKTKSKPSTKKETSP